jgi:3-oxoacyl-[acyl-carrier-protein] synthase-1
MVLYAADKRSAAKAASFVPWCLPPHCWDGVYDEEIPSLSFADTESSGENARICMSNSFAFGGCNTSLILGRGNA